MITLPQPAQEIIETLSKHGFESFAVGGSIRDLLLGLPTKDWDFTTNAPPQKVLALFPDSFYDNEFGTVGIPYKTDSDTEVYEITTYRSEHGFSNKRHPDEVTWGTSLEADLARRDLTINAIAFDGKKLIDPFAGQKDLQKKLVRTVGKPEDRFQEDALRLIRTIRIAAQLGFTIESQTLSAISSNTGLIKSVSSDRVRMELMKIIGSKYAADGVMLLRNTKLLAEILPELDQCFGVPQKSPKRHHLYDVGTHLIMSLHNCPATDPLVRLATLLHDIGKSVVFRKDVTTQIITFYNHEVVGAKLVKEIALRLNFSKKDREKLVTLVRWHQFTVDENQNDNTLRRFIRRVGKENLKDILDLRIGDRLGGGAQETSWRLRLFMARLDEVQKQPFTVSDLKINGHDVMKVLDIKPGPQVGKILNKLFDEVIIQKIANERETLLIHLKKVNP
ncbi:TPA: hypothetical protein DIV55_00755 [Patescibacteria group bacterium]|uniref:tRNA adenylyl-/cytidylyl-transferase n=1 Tax=Candidatus Gottesmanbacteria bacterium GW2011_GWA1_43_11 TaxID=1618436 RepID=A0A0G1CIZ9_9BACT|nr:MAG: tRNA adenylyl-/cytidylyl-transferase [Candidatus Gottesmanbacteria bacterium GW2011_GWA1_43_11]HCS78254.1 hypothetical protein [Patescibacteria group bacterium]